MKYGRQVRRVLLLLFRGQGIRNPHTRVQVAVHALQGHDLLTRRSPKSALNPRSQLFDVIPQLPFPRLIQSSGRVGARMCGFSHAHAGEGSSSPHALRDPHLRSWLVNRDGRLDHACARQIVGKICQQFAACMLLRPHACIHDRPRAILQRYSGKIGVEFQTMNGTRIKHSCRLIVPCRE